MTAAKPTPSGVRGARVFHPDGHFSRVPHLSWGDGVFRLGDTETTRGGDDLIDGADLWVIPGIIDTHTHLAWTDFDSDERDQRDPDERERLIRESLAATLAAGVTGARDAGGLDARHRDAVVAGVSGPRLVTSVDLITRESAASAGGIGAAVEQMLAAGADWIKLVGTDGVSSHGGGHRVSHFTKAEYVEAVRRAEVGGARVMVHAWGGDAITWAIEAGVASVEHGIYLTDEQARLGAEAGAVLVPTLHIYRLVQRMVVDGSLPAVLADRVADAVASHPVAVRRARDAGMPIALGTDFGTIDQHGHNAVEIVELVRAGLSLAEALRAATSVGAELVYGSGPGVPQGEVVDGAVADAVILRSDPLDPATFASPDAVVAVVVGGRVVRGTVVGE